MIYVLIALVCAIAWMATRRIADPARRVGAAIAAIGLVLAAAMWWMAFPFLVIAAFGAAVVAVSHLQQRRRA